MGTKKERSTEAALHLLSAVLRKPNNEDIVIPQSHAIRERATMIHLALLIEISQVSLNKTKHNASRFFSRNVFEVRHPRSTSRHTVRQHAA